MGILLRLVTVARRFTRSGRFMGVARRLTGVVFMAVSIFLSLKYILQVVPR